MKHLLFSIFFAACSSDEGVKVYNTDPSASITSHEENAELLDGYEIIFRGSVSDANHQNTELSVTWMTDLRELCPAQFAVADGTTTCTTKLEEGDAQIKLQVVDPEGAAFVQTINVNVLPTEAPSAEITAPISGEFFYRDQLVLFSAIIGDAEDTPQELVYQWTSSEDGILPIDIVPETSGEIEQFVGLSEGQHAITLTVEDTSGKTTNETVAITVGGPNNEPSCSITSPQEGAAYVLGQSISFSGSALDEDINNSQLTISWESNIDGVFESTSPITDGTLGFSVNTLSSGNHTITLRVEDEVDGLCTDAVQVAVGTAPTITITTPLEGDVFSVGDSISFQGSVQDQEDIAPDIAISWVSDIDGEFSTQSANSNGSISFNTSSMSAGLHSILVTATDSTGLTDSTSFGLRINTPPTPPVVSITPNPATTSDMLVATASGSSDADGDNITYTYSWMQNGIVTSYGTASIPSSATTSGEVWTVQAIPNDGYTDGNYTEESLIISNSPPSITAVSISPSAAYNDDALSCSAIVNDPDESLVPTYTWTVGSVSYIGPVLDLSTTTSMPGDVVICTAEVTDSAGESISSDASLTIVNRAPVVGGVNLSPAQVYTNSIAVCSASVVDDDGESLTPVYEWFVASSSIGVGASITLNNTLVSVGAALTCTASATDGYGSSHSSDVTTTILNTEPSVDSVDIDLSLPTASDTLTCTAMASDVDGDTPTYSFSWSNRSTGDVYSNTTTSLDSATLNLDATVAQAGDDIECMVVVEDDDGGSSFDTAVVTIYNSVPQFDTAAYIDINPDVYVDDVLTCSAAASDPNDGMIVPTYVWSVGGINFANGATYTVDSTNTNVGDELVCTATAIDSDGETVTSQAMVTVQNTSPIVRNVTVQSASGNNYNDDVLTCSGDIEDVDENISNTDTIWTLGNVQIGTGTTLDLSATTAMPADVIECTIQTTDDELATAEETGTVTLSNRAPSLTAASIDDTAPYADSMILCSSSVSDDDGESLSIGYAWGNGSTLLGSNAELILTPSDVDVGDIITCTASVSDAYGGVDTTTATAVVQNTDPTMSAVTLAPSSPTITDTLTCSATGTDLNDGSLSPVYTWKNNTTGATLGGASNLILNSSTSSSGDEIQCTVSFYDSHGADVQDIALVTVFNDPPVFDTAAQISPSSNVKVGTSLTCSAVASDTDGTPTLSYSWTVGSIEVSTGSTYVVSASDTDVGDNVMCTVTATDAGGEAATSSDDVTVLNSSPVITDVEMSPSSQQYNDETFSCSFTYTDADADAVTYTVEWYTTFQGVLLFTGEELDATTTTLMPRDYLYCRVTIDDGHGDTDTDTDGAFIDNRPPSEPGVEITPSSPVEGQDDLVCTISTPSVDLDGQTVSYTYVWKKNGSTTSYTSNTISSSVIQGGETWRCIVTPYDGQNYGWDRGYDSVVVLESCTGFLTDCDETLDLGGGQGIDFVHITAGSFAMGSPTNEQGRSSNEDQHPVTLTNDFLIATTEITQGMYYQMMGIQAYDAQNPNYGAGNDYPAYYMSWHMAAAFSNKVTQRYNSLNGASLQECYDCTGTGSNVECSTDIQPIYSCTGYRMLTEAEWEYAARGNSSYAFWTSNGGGELPSGYTTTTTILSDGFDLTSYGWYRPSNTSNTSMEVASLLPNEYGVYDMSGSLWEWAHDSYISSLGSASVIDPVRESDSSRSIRGGYWDSSTSSIRSARRSEALGAEVRSHTIGARIGRTE